MSPVVSIRQLSKTYRSGFQALKSVDLDIARGEILALLGPNGAGKTTLISIVCGLVTPTSGTVTVGGHDIVTGYRQTRAMIGLVPQELSTDAFEKVHAAVSFSRGLFGRPADRAHVREVLESLSLWEKRDQPIMTLSGGMKRRLMIAKALAHEPSVLFLDEPTAGVDVELRKDMWQLVHRLRESGVTIILTTHYIEEAEEIADRVGVINKGELMVVEEKTELMRKLGKKQLVLELQEPIAKLPPALEGHGLELSEDGARLVYTYDTQALHTGVTPLLGAIGEAGIEYRDLSTRQSSLEDIFVTLVEEVAVNLHGVRAIYLYEMSRTKRTVMQSVVSPVISTTLYFVVFGSAIGSRIDEIDGVSYGAFLVPGLIMLSLLTQSISNASFAIYFPKFIGTIYELLSAPLSPFEIVVGYVGAAATKSTILGLIILATASLLVPMRIAHPGFMLLFLVLTAVTFSLFGFLIGIWADSFEKLQVIPLLIVTPLVFLGGSFYSISMLPPFWQSVTLFNPVLYLVSGFRWSFYENADVSVVASLGMVSLFLALCLGLTWLIFRTGYQLKP